MNWLSKKLSVPLVKPGPKPRKPYRPRQPMSEEHKRKISEALKGKRHRKGTSPNRMSLITYLDMKFPSTEWRNAFEAPCSHYNDLMMGSHPSAASTSSRCLMTRFLTSSVPLPSTSRDSIPNMNRPSVSFQLVLVLHPSGSGSTAR